MSAAYDAGLDAATRRERGAHFTPAPIGARLAAVALDGMPRAATVCDPSCGDGSLLLAAGEALVAGGAPRATVGRDLLWGVDADPGALHAARAAIRAWSGVDPGDHLVVGDGLQVGERWAGRFDVVLGNPPFLNQLRMATARSGALPPALAALAGPYTDTAWLFLAVSVGLVRPGGRVVLVQPQSIVAARDARRVREQVAERAAVEGMWTCDEHVFPDAAVRVCAPVLRVGGPPAAEVRRWVGPDLAPASPAGPVEGAPGASWARLLAPADPAPAFEIVGQAGTLGDLATATAGFRDQFYGLAPFVVDDAGLPDATHPPLVTTRHVDVGALAWGARPVRFAGRRLLHPRVDRAALAATDPRLHRWVEARLVPKVVVATQTRVVEAAVDAAGAVVPSTPVISVEGAADPWAVAAVLVAPPVSAWALQHHGGTARSAGAIKLAARDVLQAPLPTDDSRWREAADLLRARDVAGAAEAMVDAYGVGAEVLAWWRRRAGLAG